jgi:leucyl aminopeptidase (aminopeptidase T)
MTCPEENSIEGRIIVDGGVFFDLTTLPIELIIEQGKLTRMNCQDAGNAVFRQYRQWMMEAFEANPANAQLCEVGLGANPEARLDSVVMESEAVQGTVHFCFGDNTLFEGMGGQNHTGWHGGTVILKEPRLRLF